MSTLTTIAASDIISASRAVINANFAALNADKVDIASTYADPPWLTSIAGSKVTGNIPGGAATATLAAAATALATPRTIAGVNFDGTANISIASTGLSDSSSLVRGAAALSTVGQVPFVSAAGALGASANLFWDNANARLGVGTNAPQSRVEIVGPTQSWDGAALRFRGTGTGARTYGFYITSAGQFDFGDITAANSRFLIQPTGNVGVGVSPALADGNFRLDVGSSGSAGTARIYDQTATTGLTSLVVRAGAGQSTNALTTWQTSAGSNLVTIFDNGVRVFIGNSTTASRTVFYGTDRLGLNIPAAGSGGVTLDADSAGILRWNAATGLGAWDTGLARNAAGVLEVNNGTAGQFRDLRVRDLFQNGTVNTAVFGGQAVAAGQVLYGTAAGVAGTSANLFWDAANNRLGVGTNTPARPLHVRNAGGFRVDVVGSGFEFANTDTGVWQILPVNSLVRFGINNAMFFPGASANVLLGTTTDDGTNRLQVAGGIVGTGRVRSTGGNIEVFTGFGLQQVNANGMGISFPSALIQFNSSAGNSLAAFTDAGALEIRNQTPTTGSTSLVVRAGAGQSGNLMTWQNAAGAAMSAIRNDGWAQFNLATGVVALDSGGTQKVALSGAGNANGVGGVAFANNAYLSFSNDSTQFGTKDLNFGRFAAATAFLGSGGNNTNGLLYLKGIRAVGSTVADLPPASGNTGMRATVTDATATTIGTTVAGGGAFTVLVWSNGTNWRIYAN